MIDRAIKQPPPPSLEQRIAAALSNPNSSGAELSELVAETELAIVAAEEDVATLRERASDLVQCPDAKGAFDAADIAEINRKRLDSALPRLREKMAAAMATERRDKWLADYVKVEVERDEAVATFRRYPNWRPRWPTCSLLPTRPTAKLIASMAPRPMACTCG